MRNKKYNIIVVGVGGTGSWFVTALTRYLQGDLARDITGLFMVDGDIVEEKNLKNQAYQQEDVGYKKCLIQSMIRNGALGRALWNCYDKYITSADEIRAFMKKDADVINVIVGCSDNHNCRLLLEECFFDSTYENVCLYDSANEYEDGEVVFAHKFKNVIYSPPRSVVFPDIKTGDLRNVTEMSCEELNNVAPQHPMINEQMSILLMKGIDSLIRKKKIMPGFYMLASTGEISFNETTHLTEMIGGGCK